MPIIAIPDPPSRSFFERQLPNSKYRYEGRFHTIHYCIDSETRKTEDQIEEFLDSCSVDFLIDNEKYIIRIK